MGLQGRPPRNKTKPSPGHWNATWACVGRLQSLSHIHSPTVHVALNISVGLVNSSEALISKQDTFVLETPPPLPPPSSLSTSIIRSLISHIASGICLLQNSGLDYKCLEWSPRTWLNTSLWCSHLVASPILWCVMAGKPTHFSSVEPAKGSSTDQSWYWLQLSVKPDQKHLFSLKLLPSWQITFVGYEM